MDGYARITKKSYREDGRVLISLTVGNECGCEEAELLILGELLGEKCSELEPGEIDGETLSLLDELSSVTAAFSSACASLAFSQCSARGLVRKLLAKGFSRSACEAAVEICLEKGYVDEISTATRRAEIMVGKPWGKARILAKLRQEGYSSDALEAVCEYLSTQDFAKICSDLILKRYRELPLERSEIERMCSALMRLGFSRSDIRDAVKRLSKDE